MSTYEPETIFTPRSAEVNRLSYIPRPDLEDALRDALRMPKHIVIHGESGTGKSWLYKRVLTQQGWDYEVANMGLCGNQRSISDVLKTSLARTTGMRTARTNTQVVKIGIGGTGGEAQTVEEFEFVHEPLLAIMQKLHDRAAGKKGACLVFDNLEQVTSSKELSKELAGLILLVDDDSYAQYGVKILLVGTSNEVRSFVSNIGLSNTISNRLTEVPEVSRLSAAQVYELVQKCFVELLRCDFQESPGFSLDSFKKRVAWFSDAIPQYLQELCLYIALQAQRSDWLIGDAVFWDGLRAWIKASLVKDVTRVQANLNSPTTKLGRRNQVIYCLGACAKYDFSKGDIEEILQRHFPKSLMGVALNVSQILGELLDSDHAIIRRSPIGNFYRFVDPKFRILVRWMLKRDEETEALSQRAFDDSLKLWSKKGDGR